MRPSAIIRVVEESLGAIVKTCVGGAAVAGGAWLVKHSLEQEDHKLAFVGVGVAVLGGLIVPSIWGAVKPVLVFVFPNGIPLIGGRRATDPAAPPKPFDFNKPDA